MSEPAAGTDNLSELESNVAFGSDNAAGLAARADALRGTAATGTTPCRTYRQAIALDAGRRRPAVRAWAEAYLGAGDAGGRGGLPRLHRPEPAQPRVRYFSLGALYESQGRARPRRPRPTSSASSSPADPVQIADVKERLERLLPGSTQAVDPALQVAIGAGGGSWLLLWRAWPS